MYKIGDFSKITNLTVKALRYYDEENILNPSYRCEENSYRFYDDNDFKKAELIVLLRELNFSISEIKDVMNICEDKADLSYILEEKKDMVNKNIMEEKALLKKISLYIKPNLLEDDGVNYIIQVKDIPAIKVAAIRYKGKYSDCGKHMGRIYKAIKGDAKGEPFNCYYDGEYKEEADIETCVPISKQVYDSVVTIVELPQIRAVSTIHNGTYESINMAYKAIFDYAKGKNISCLTPSREIYIKGPGMIFKGNSKNYITEVIIPIELEV
ncbi:MerR family transcriptional regulator [Clostridium estertheticum]|uniref:MerR family transcriptional regulator n=1 Tax=Clostridium estertheticum TaxID=238834 RepID=UPI0013E93FAB|nr:MerR family transcriptional regulator [Clostridium estertheticum]MBZ9689613.1 MerR family transcriptional regulator [Clostridium estertheticum]